MIVKLVSYTGRTIVVWRKDSGNFYFIFLTMDKPFCLGDYLPFLYLVFILSIQYSNALILVVDWVMSCCLTSEIQSLRDLIAAILQRVGDDIDPNNLPQIEV